MIRIKLANTVVEEGANTVIEYDDGLIHGTKVLLYLVVLWGHTDRIICSNSQFA